MPKDLDELRARKEELLLESEINRQIISLECSQLRLKAVEWRRSLTKAGSIYKWVSPIAGIAMGFFAAKKQARRTQHREPHHNGHDKFSLLSVLAPMGAFALKQGFEFWQQSRSRPQSER